MQDVGVLNRIGQEVRDGATLQLPSLQPHSQERERRTADMIV